MPNRIFNHAKGKIELQWNDADSSPVDILISDSIGEDPWSESGGLSASRFNEMLNTVPRNRDLNFKVNSPGGDVYDGMAIKEMIRSWPKNVTTDYIGVAASTASWCFIDSDKIRATKNSQVFIHDAMTICLGNEADMLKAASNLGLTSNQIAGMYAAKNGHSVDEMRKMMRDETLMTGEQAKALGLVDEIIDGDATYNFTDKNIACMKGRLSNIRNVILSAPTPARATNQQNKIMRNKLIAALNKMGVKFDDKLTDEELLALFNANFKNEDPEPTPEELAAAKKKKEDKEAAEAAEGETENRLKKLENQLKTATALVNAQKKSTVEAALRNHIAAGRMQEIEFKDAVELAMDEKTGEKFLNSIGHRRAVEIGTEPLAPGGEITGEGFEDVQKHILKNGPELRGKFIGAQNAARVVDERARKDIAAGAITMANTIRKHRNMLKAMWNTNTISADLQRQVILQEMLEAFAVRLAPVTAFAHTFNNVPLEKYQGKVVVAYYPLQTAASRDFNGTYTMDDTNVEDREVTIDKRKYLGLAFTSQELRQLPWVNWEKLAVQNANKLAVDIFTDVVQNVITVANFGASVKAVPAAMFSADDVADLWEVATGLNWPDTARSLVLNHTYKTPLLKDATFKSALAYGSTDPIRKAMIQEAYGFENLFTVPNLTNYSPAGQNLVGWINHESAVLVATSPVMPSEDVRAVMTRYDIATSPELGVSLEYRRWGAPGTDTTNELVECNYGRDKGVDAALRRLTSS